MAAQEPADVPKGDIAPSVIAQAFAYEPGEGVPKDTIGHPILTARRREAAMRRRRRRFFLIVERQMVPACATAA
jgi:hypothetical protein